MILVKIKVGGFFGSQNNQLLAAFRNYPDGKAVDMKTFRSGHRVSSRLALEGHFRQFLH